MTDDISDIIARYNSDPGNEEKRLDFHQLEYDLTWKYFDSYFCPGGKILEIGAATGRYTVELARRGYQVTAIDPASSLLEVNKKRISAAGFSDRVEFITTDARNLDDLNIEEYDMVLLMGPLYHLVDLADRKLAVREAVKHLKKNGVIFSSFISRFGIMADELKNDPEWIKKEEDVQSIIKRGRDLENYPKGGFRGYFCTCEEIASLFSGENIQSLVLAAVEPCIASEDEIYNRLDGETRKCWLDLLYQLSTEKTIIGASRHLLHIGKKK